MDVSATLGNLTTDAKSVLCDHWKRKEEKHVVSHPEFSVSCLEESTSSIGSISSLDLSDDALSSLSSSSQSLSSTSSLSSQNEAQELPIKKGLSKYYQVKSQTFTSLSDVKCIEDLAKKENNYRKKDHRTSLSPNATISKKVARSASGQKNMQIL